METVAAIALSLVLPAPAWAGTGEEAWLAANLETTARYAQTVEACRPGFAANVPPIDDTLDAALRCTFRTLAGTHGERAAHAEIARARFDGATPLGLLLGLRSPSADDLALSDAADSCEVFEAALASPMMTTLVDNVGSGCGSVW